MTFYVAGFQEPGQYGAAVGDSYSVSVGNDTSGIQSFNSTGWIQQTFDFTADSGSETIIFQGPGGTESPYRMTHFSLASDAVAPLVLDADGDGIDDVAEANLGTDPNNADSDGDGLNDCLLYTSPSPRDGLLSRMPSSA